MKRSDEHHGYEVHSLAISFPLMEKSDKPGFKELVADIKEHGLQQPIVLDGKVLVDGRNRLSACKEAGVEPRFVAFADVAGGLSPVEYILAHNLHRRHLTDDGRAFIKLATREFYKTVEGAEEVQRFPGRFKKGDPRQNPGGKRKAVARTDSCEPQKRDCKAEHARSTVGQLAAEAKVSYAMARDILKIVKAIKKGTLPPEVADELMAGTAKASEIVQRIPPADDSAKPRKRRAPLVQRVRSSLAKLLSKFTDGEQSEVRRLLIAELT